MDIQALLDSVRHDFPECRAIAFGDLSTGLVLCVSAARKTPQERLDRLCRTAGELLDGATAGHAAALAPDGAGAVTQAVALSGGTLEIFLRSPLVATDTLCCICSANVNIDALIDRARAGLRDIGNG